jgi:2-C-methyl-D-erythritol 4-phosphate cytidylyltransferase
VGAAGTLGEYSEVGAVIVAAGTSERMGMDKQLALVGDTPVLGHTLRAFQRSPAVSRIVVVLNRSNLEAARAIITMERFHKVVATPLGGSTRQESVLIGLEALGMCDFVLIHDGARPFVSADLIGKTLDAARHHGAALPGVPIRETVKEVSPEGLVAGTVDRRGLWLAQTPQAFRYTVILEAHRWARGEGFSATDDAALLEARGTPVAVIQGSPTNLKLTTVEDLEMARALWAGGFRP